MKILGIESTCDETGVGIVEDGKKVLSNVISSSAGLFEKYGGIVPEVAAREQVKVIVPVLNEALEKAGVSLEDLDAVSVANGPGLVGSLLIGVEAAKVISTVYDIPLIPLNHLVGHVYANWTDRQEVPDFPLVALLVSGGHTELILMRGFQNYVRLGSTRDDAAGEVFDKVARILGLGYPGGPQIENRANLFNRDLLEVKFPSPLIDDESFDFSFSGLKTAVARFVENSGADLVDKNEIAYSFQKAIIEVLVKKTVRAALKFGIKNIVIGGGVAANLALKKEFEVACGQHKIKFFSPLPGLSIDNGAMIASAAYYVNRAVEPMKLQVSPDLKLN